MKEPREIALKKWQNTIESNNPPYDREKHVDNADMITEIDFLAGWQSAVAVVMNLAEKSQGKIDAEDLYRALGFSK